MRKVAKQWGAVCILAMGVCLLLASAQAAAETGTWKGRDVQVTTKVEVLKIEDVEGHIIAAYEMTGLSTNLTTGEVSSLIIRGVIDYTKGSGIHEGYNTTTSEDGSTTTVKFRGTTRKEPEGEGSSFEGTSTYVHGTGRWAGIQGEGTYTGRRLAPLDAAAGVYSDWTMTYTLPE